MKNIIKGAICLALGAVSLTGCKKEFLEEPRPGTQVSSADVFATEAGIRSFFNGMYRNLRTQWGTSTDAWGIVSVNMAREVKSLDASLPNGNWYNFDYLHENREPTYRRTVFTWEYFYSFINAANNMIAGLKTSPVADAIKTPFEAEARAFRAWCYFELVREFAKPYNENPEGMGLPLYTEPTTPQTSGNPRSKTSDVYKLILEDLEFAAPIIPATRVNGGLKDIINKNVVNGLLARVYLEMGMRDNAYLTKAIAAAQAARTGTVLEPAKLSVAMTTDFSGKSEVLWGFPQAADQTIYYGTPSAFWGTGGTGYFNIFVDSNFVNKFSTTDVRRAMFVTPGGTGLSRWKTNKFGTTTNFTDFIVTMRTPEMYLIEAEAKARLNDATARSVLYTIQKNRDPNAVESSNTGEALIDEILLEKRKELFGEIGIGYLDLRRTGKALVRSVGHPTNARFNFPGNSVIFTMKIPQKEFDANKALTPADQNP